ncbi:hypothetical protein ACOMHN_001044 [Nucella lapillus]
MALAEKETGSTKLTEAASRIGDASLVRQMPNLEVCSLSVNELTSLEDFAHCPSLQELYIRKNLVETLSDVLHLRKLERLRVLWLSDNPCSEGDNYRMTVLRTLPNLQKLDNFVVTEEEINKALEEGDDLTQGDAEGGGRDKPIRDFTNTDTNTNTNADPSTTDLQDATTTEPTTTTATTADRHSISADTFSDSADDKEEEKDSGVEMSSAAHLHPQPSERGPSLGPSAADLQRSRLQESVKLNWEETNLIRSELGMKLIPMSKVTSPKSVTTGATKARNANILQSVLLLIRELDKDSLEIVHSTVQQRLENM